MSEISTPEMEKLHARAAWPRYFRVGALGILVSTVVIGVLIFVFTERRSDFRMKSFPTRLSKDVVAVVDGYERRESDGSRVRYYIKADRTTTFTDNHQELENVYLEVYDDQGVRFDRMTSQKAVYVPAADGDFTVYFAGSVNIDTRDSLNVKTEQVTYKRIEETAEAEEKVDFAREEFRGSAVGAVVRIREQRLELLREVEFSGVASSSRGAAMRNGSDSFKGTSGAAVLDQAAGTVTLSGRVDIRIAPKEGEGSTNQPSEVKADSAVAHFLEREVERIELSGNVSLEQFSTKRSPRWTKTKSERGVAFIEGDVFRFELSGSAEIRTAANGLKPSVIKAGSAAYDKKSDRFDLREAVSIVTEEGDRPVTISGSAAVYEQGKGRIEISGQAEISTPSENLKAAAASALLDSNRRLKSADAKGNALLVQRSPERTIEVSGGRLAASFDADGNLLKAEATEVPKAQVVPVAGGEYSRVAVTPAKSLVATFAGAGLMRAVETDGRTTIELTAPASGPDAADKKLTADAVKTTFAPDGKNLVKAEATGSAELQVIPQQALDGSYRTTVNAPSFTCEFFPTGNNAKSCVGGVKTRTVRSPMVRSSARSDQTLQSDRLKADFNGRSQDVETLEAIGGAKFSEADRNGASSRMMFTASSGVVSLRDGQPAVWDSRGRARAQEIDIDTKTEISRLRGSVSSTYYNQRQMNGASPFANPSAPVYVTSGTAEFMYSEDRAVFTGNARAWQGNNFVRGDSLEMRLRQRSLSVTGNVQSMMFDARLKDSGKDSTVPVFGTSQKMTYDGESRRVVYETGVELRQGSDKLTGQKVTAVLNDKNEMVEALAESGVTLSQPGRKATGSFAQYKVAEDVVVLRGDPARIEDSVSGASEGAEMTVYLRERRVVGDGRTKTNSSGRIRSVYKVNKDQ